MRAPTTESGGHRADCYMSESQTRPLLGNMTHTKKMRGCDPITMRVTFKQLSLRRYTVSPQFQNYKSITQHANVRRAESENTGNRISNGPPSVHLHTTRPRTHNPVDYRATALLIVSVDSCDL